MNQQTTTARVSARAPLLVRLCHITRRIDRCPRVGGETQAARSKSLEDALFLRAYRIVHRVIDDGIVVLTVFEGHRLLGAIDPDDD
ncbi:MAG: hypothetical protein KF901_19510 [Myxococcales bacterium]|nr:hypothetical protein [Myxococcales bacterium]